MIFICIRALHLLDTLACSKVLGMPSLHEEPTAIRLLQCYSADNDSTGTVVVDNNVQLTLLRQRF